VTVGLGAIGGFAPYLMSRGMLGGEKGGQRATRKVSLSIVLVLQGDNGLWQVRGPDTVKGIRGKINRKSTLEQLSNCCERGTEQSLNERKNEQRQRKQKRDKA